MAATRPAPGNPRRQEFPADQASRDLFVRENTPASITNVWAIEIVPGHLLAYELEAPGPLLPRRVRSQPPRRRAAAALGRALSRRPEVDGGPRKLMAGDDILTHLTGPIRCRKSTSGAGS